MSKSPYESWGEEDFPKEIKRERYEITPSGEEGWNTLRTKFKVTCIECNEELHPSTTWPSHYAEQHENQKHKR